MKEKTDSFEELSEERIYLSMLLDLSKENDEYQNLIESFLVLSEQEKNNFTEGLKKIDFAKIEVLPRENSLTKGIGFFRKKFGL